MTVPQDALDASLIIFDFLVGRVKGGHQEDYLAAMERALAGFRPRTVAPYRQDWPPGTIKMHVTLPPGRLGRYLAGIGVCRRLLNATEPNLLVFPNNDFRDFLVFAVAALLRRRGGRGWGLFVMRRDGFGITGSRRLGWVLEHLVSWLARHAPFSMTSDTRAAMDFWREKTGCEATILSIPVRKAPQGCARSPGQAPRIGLIGSFRAEKGAAAYAQLIRLALEMNPETIVECQISQGSSPAEQNIARAIVGEFEANPRVHLHVDHLTSEQFTRLLYSVDIVVLPYVAETYGTGTSGVLFEGVAAGRIVAVTPIVWGVAEYGDHPAVVWLKGIDPDSLRLGLSEAVARLQRTNAAGASGSPAGDLFQETWIAALQRAQADSVAALGKKT